MSAYQSALAWRTKVHPATKIILLAMADEADDDGIFVAPLKRLAEKCMIDARQVQRHLGILKSRGLLVVEGRDLNGKTLPNCYVLTLDGRLSAAKQEIAKGTAEEQALRVELQKEFAELGIEGGVGTVRGGESVRGVLPSSPQVSPPLDTPLPSYIPPSPNSSSASGTQSVPPTDGAPSAASVEGEAVLKRRRAKFRAVILDALADSGVPPEKVPALTVMNRWCKLLESKGVVGRIVPLMDDLVCSGVLRRLDDPMPYLNRCIKNIAEGNEQPTGQFTRPVSRSTGKPREETIVTLGGINKPYSRFTDADWATFNRALAESIEIEYPHE